MRRCRVCDVDAAAGAGGDVDGEVDADADADITVELLTYAFALSSDWTRVSAVVVAVIRTSDSQEWRERSQKETTVVTGSELHLSGRRDGLKCEVAGVSK